jgi:phosphocarrier protein
VRLENTNGLHARPAHLIVQTANAYASVLTIGREGEQGVDAKSIMNVMMLAAENGAVLELESTGPDCDEQVRAIIELFASRFGEE